MDSIHGKYYKQNQIISTEQRVTRRYENISSFAHMVSMLLDKYRIRYINNLEFILEYVGLSRAQYAKGLRGMGLPTSVTLISAIESGNMLWFDMKFMGCLSSYFHLPFDLILNYDLEEDGIDLMDYGLQRNCYKKRGVGFRRSRSKFVDERPIVIARSIIVNNAYKRTQKAAPRAFSVWDFVARKERKDAIRKG
jgi:hypothetical protein